MEISDRRPDADVYADVILPTDLLFSPPRLFDSGVHRFDPLPSGKGSRPFSGCKAVVHQNVKSFPLFSCTILPPPRRFAACTVFKFPSCPTPASDLSAIFSLCTTVALFSRFSPSHLDWAKGDTIARLSSAPLPSFFQFFAPLYRFSPRRRRNCSLLRLLQLLHLRNMLPYC